ncbi:hypothetical protein D3C77_668600 [compost metagenome]
MRVEQFGNQLRDFRRGVELTGFLAAAGGEVFDQVFIGVADHVQAADAGGFEVEFFSGEVFEQMTQYGVLLFFLTKLVGIEGDVLKHALASVL